MGSQQWKPGDVAVIRWHGVTPVTVLALLSRGRVQVKTVRGGAMLVCHHTHLDRE